MPRLAGILLVVLALAGCSTEGFQAPGYEPPGPVAPPATATILGHGAYHREGGAVVTCSGYSVALMPARPPYVDRIAALYGSSSGRVMESVATIKARSAKLPPSPPPSATATCDGRGAFEFSGLQPGGYFLIARVRQRLLSNHGDDYVILERVVLQPGERADISLAP